MFLQQIKPKSSQVKSSQSQSQQMDEEIMKIEYEINDITRALKTVKENIVERRLLKHDVEDLEKIKRNLVSAKCEMWDRLTQIEIENYPKLIKDCN